jgi:hypothetical protein
MSLDVKIRMKTPDLSALESGGASLLGSYCDFFAPKLHNTSTLSGSGIRQILNAG